MWGERITRSLVMRLLCGAWLVPAASLIWIGLAAVGIRHASESSQTLALGRTQASAILLAVFTVLIGASVLVRQLTDPAQPAPAAPTGPRPGPGVPWIWSHGLAAVVAAAIAIFASATDGATDLLFPLAAGFGLWAALAIPRIMLRHFEGWSSPLAALAAGISFQLTVGWLHLANPDAVLSPVLVLEGLILAWVAASAARVDPFAAVPMVLVVEAAPTDLTAPATPASSGFSPSPAQQPIPEAAVGR